MPEWLENQPVIDDEILFFIDAFNVLDKTRLHYNSPQALQLSEIKNYIELFSVKYDVDDFVSIMLELDAMFFGKYIERQKLEQDVREKATNLDRDRKR